MSKFPPLFPCYTCRAMVNEPRSICPNCKARMAKIEQVKPRKQINFHLTASEFHYDRYNFYLSLVPGGYFRLFRTISEEGFGGRLIAPDIEWLKDYFKNCHAIASWYRNNIWPSDEECVRAILRWTGEVECDFYRSYDDMLSDEMWEAQTQMTSSI